MSDRGAARQRAERALEIIRSFRLPHEESGFPAWALADDGDPAATWVIGRYQARRLLTALSDRVEAAENRAQSLEHLAKQRHDKIRELENRPNNAARFYERAVAAEKERDEAWAAVNSEEDGYVRQRELRLAAEERVAALNTTEAQIMRAALDEDKGEVIGLIYDLDEKRLDALIEAVQLIDTEACDCADAVFPASPNTEATKQ